ncbi:hypothetical protein L2E82_13052 [Cichorium intybus]|uniref:Uncharacterized protein n=1 Tax=Cichorium intybus TaxID=13427 RepID=A0ACB9GIF2_CICIN|nr:hypothetical protein L2E82_13052 [Cichorium intybus]
MPTSSPVTIKKWERRKKVLQFSYDWFQLQGPVSFMLRRRTQERYRRSSNSESTILVSIVTSFLLKPR